MLIAPKINSMIQKSKRIIKMLKIVIEIIYIIE